MKKVGTKMISTLFHFYRADSLYFINKSLYLTHKVAIDSTHPLMFGYPDYYYTIKLSPDVYNFLTPDQGWNVGYLKKDNYVAGFVGSKIKPLLNDGTLYAVQNLGKGAVIYLGDDIIFRNFWQFGKLMLANATFMVENQSLFSPY